MYNKRTRHDLGLYEMTCNTDWQGGMKSDNMEMDDGSFFWRSSVYEKQLIILQC
jgi:hypothetical protein